MLPISRPTTRFAGFNAVSKNTQMCTSYGSEIVKWSTGYINAAGNNITLFKILANCEDLFQTEDERVVLKQKGIIRSECTLFSDYVRINIYVLSVGLDNVQILLQLFAQYAKAPFIRST